MLFASDLCYTFTHVSQWSSCPDVQLHLLKDRFFDLQIGGGGGRGGGGAGRAENWSLNFVVTYRWAEPSMFVGSSSHASNVGVFSAL